MHNCLKITLIIVGILVILPWLVAFWYSRANASITVQQATCTIVVNVHDIYGYISYGLTYHAANNMNYDTIFCTDWGNRGSCGNYRDGQIENCYIIPTPNFVYSCMSEYQAKCQVSGYCDDIESWFYIGGFTTLFFTCLALTGTLISFCNRRDKTSADFTNAPVPRREIV